MVENSDVEEDNNVYYFGKVISYCGYSDLFLKKLRFINDGKQ